MFTFHEMRVALFLGQDSQEQQSTRVEDLPWWKYQRVQWDELTSGRPGGNVDFTYWKTKIMSVTNKSINPGKNGASLHVVSHHFPDCHHGGGPDHVQALALWYCEWLDTYYDRALTQPVIRCRPWGFCMGSLWWLHGDLFIFLFYGDLMTRCFKTGRSSLGLELVEDVY